MVFDLNNGKNFYDYIKKLSEYYKSKAESVHQSKAFRKPSPEEITAIKKSAGAIF